MQTAPTAPQQRQSSDAECKMCNVEYKHTQKHKNTNKTKQNKTNQTTKQQTQLLIFFFGLTTLIVGVVALGESAPGSFTYEDYYCYESTNPSCTTPSYYDEITSITFTVNWNGICGLGQCTAGDTIALDNAEDASVG